MTVHDTLSAAVHVLDDLAVDVDPADVPLVAHEDELVDHVAGGLVAEEVRDGVAADRLGGHRDELRVELRINECVRFERNISLQEQFWEEDGFVRLQRNTLFEMA